jgi:excisionase family DNA binding protein
MKKRGRPKNAATRRLQEPEISNDIIMTSRQVAEYLNCHYTTLMRLLWKGDLPGFRLGGTWRCRRQDIDRWIAKQTVMPNKSKAR